MKRYFKFDKNIKKIVAQLSIMIIVAFFLFYGFKSSHQFYFLPLLLIVFLFISFLIYRLCFLNFIFEDKQVIFKSIFKKIVYLKTDIKDIFLITLNDKKKHNINDYNQIFSSKIYLVIAKNENVGTDLFKFSLFSVVNEDRMILEFSSNVLTILKNNKYID